MPFLAPAIPAIIGAAGSLGAGLFGGGSSGGSQGQLLQILESMAGKDSALRNQIIKGTEGPLNYFTGGAGGPTSTGLYRDFVTTGTEQTADAYQNAKAATAARANQSGFGYSQPIAGAAQDEVGNEEAKAQADVPRKALLDTVGPELTALNTRASEAHDYNPSSYFGPAGGAASGVDQQKQGLFSSLFDQASQGFGSLIKKKPSGGGDTSQFPWPTGDGG